MSLKPFVLVVYATPQAVREIEMEWQEFMTVLDAINQSSITVEFPEIDISTQAVGIDGQIVPLNQGLKPFERVEIYRPIRIDPKAKRFLKVRRKPASR